MGPVAGMQATQERREEDRRLAQGPRPQLASGSTAHEDILRWWQRLWSRLWGQRCCELTMCRTLSYAFRMKLSWQSSGREENRAADKASDAQGHTARKEQMRRQEAGTRAPCSQTVTSKETRR